MDVGHGTSTLPNMDSGFPVDFSLTRTPASTSWPWFTGARLTRDKYMSTHANTDEQSASDWVWDNNEGWMKGGNGNTVQSWMWKRSQGFDVVTTKGGSGKLVPHNLGGVPEMIWLKARDSAQDWRIYHMGANEGTNPEQYGFALNGTGAQNQNQGYWNNVAPTATHFSTGTWESAGGNTSVNYIMMLFRSISGISKCGYYTGTESSNAITTGFQPRFVFVKCTSTAASWVVWDTTRGVGNYLLLNSDAAQASASVVTFTSTGFTLTGTSDSSNGSGEKYIYYAHA